jgi:hypothetical protein
MENTLKLWSIGLFVSCLVISYSTAFGVAIRVPSDQPTIQAAIDAAGAGDIVLVADGTYKGGGNKNLDFQGKAITVRSENGPGGCIIDCEGDGRGFNFRSEEGQGSVVSGFTITKGRIDGDGGGIYCLSSSPTITDCVVLENWVSDPTPFDGRGGGIFCDSASPNIINCTISRNHAARGGGIACRNSSFAHITNCIISENEAHEGSGIYCVGGAPNISAPLSAQILPNLHLVLVASISSTPQL